VRSAAQFVSGFGGGQETIAAGGSTEGEEECDDLGE
jgi:hypothetical protein